MFFKRGLALNQQRLRPPLSATARSGSAWGWGPKRID